MIFSSKSCDRGFTSKAKQSCQLSEIKKKPEAELIKKFEELYNNDQRLRSKKEKKIEEYTRQKEENELKECTFKPEIMNNPEYYVSDDSFMKRKEDWKRATERKLKEKKEQEDQKLSKIAPFRPKLISAQLNTYNKEIAQSKNCNDKNNNTEKRTYKTIRYDQKKYKELVKTTTIEPFKHRRAHTEFENNLKVSMETSEGIKVVESINFNEEETFSKGTEFVESKFETEKGFSKECIEIEENYEENKEQDSDCF